MSESHAHLHTVWLLLCAAMVFIMQAGFLCVESGLTRTKNNINVALKNLADLGVSTIILWGLSYGLIFGTSIGGFIGNSLFLPSFASGDHFEISFFIYQALFCGTAVTILSGATAERMYFRSYILCAIVVSGLIYPMCAHAIWNGALTGDANGFLGRMGFIDFAGSTAVHSVGGWVSLALLIIIGPRLGMFGRGGTDPSVQARMNGSNLPVAMLGIILLWFGWFGFNGGSFFRFEDGVPAVLLNTLLGGAAGVGVSCFVSAALHKRVKVMNVMTGCLAGLVSVTAGAHVFSAFDALLCGAIGGAVANFAAVVLQRWKIDDAVEAIPAHLAAGIWGTMAVAFFGDLETMGASSRLSQAGIQFTGVAYTGAVAFGLSFIIFKVIDRFSPLRVEEEAESTGLNISEHNAATDFHDLFIGMSQHSNLKDLTRRVPEEPFTEAGMVASMYNKVMSALEGAVNHTHTVVNTAMDGILTVSGQGLTITSVNPAAEMILGCSPEKLLGTPLDQHFRLGTRDNPSPVGIGSLISKVSAEGTHLGLWAKRGSGDEFPIEIVLSEAAEVSGDFYVGVFRDVSARYEAERRLVKAKEEAEEASRSKSLFLANMSHELRTPLNAIIGYSEMLGEEAGDQSIDSEGEAMVEDLNTINKAGHHLLSLINDILDISKIEAGRMEAHFESFSVAEMLDDVVTTMQPNFDERKNRVIRRFDADALKRIDSDAMKVRQVLLNLLGNAAKFTKNGLIEVAAARFFDKKTDTEWVHLRVSDTGIGMTKDQLGKVFDAFTQASSGTTKDYGGTGLGLTITQAFVNLLGGTVTVQSEPGVGSAFNVFLPTSRSKPSSMIGNLPSTDPEAKQPPLVMVIDDDPTIFDLVNRTLAPQGYHTVGFTDAFSALNALESCKPALILLDLIMPEMDGQTLFSQIRTRPEWIGIPIVVLSIAADDPEQGRLVENADQILVKPASPSMILKTVQKWAPIDGQTNARPEVVAEHRSTDDTVALES